MKKIFFTLILIVVITASANATDYFVDYGAATSGDGLSWSTALKTLSLADAKMASSPANNDRVFVKGGVIPFGAVSWAPKSQNYYFSCAGTETQPSQRPMSDKDGNGTVEAWEFTYPSVITFAYSSTSPATVINFVASNSAIVDGVTISANASVSNTSVVLVNWSTISINTATPTSSVFQNSIISNCNLTYASNTKDIRGVLLKIADNGVAKNCLIEKNRIVSTNTSNGAPLTMISLYLSSIANTTPNITNAVIRNNFESITVDGSGIVSTDRIQAFVLGVYGGGQNATSGIANMTNCLVYNNDFSFSNPAAPSSNLTSLVGSLYGFYNGKLVMRNCEFVNNKLTNIRSGLYLTGNANYSYELINNVLWNNPNTVGTETSSTGVTISPAPSPALTASTTFSNNVLDVDKGVASWGAATYANNFYDLAQSNTGAKAPYYNNPTTFTGSNRVAGSADSIAIAQANWSLQGLDSYLATKGQAYSGISKDLIGNQFAASTPSVGPYQNMNNTTSLTSNSFEKRSRLVNVEGRNLITLTDQPISVYTTMGVLIYSGEGKGKVVNLEKSGLYIVSTTQDTYVNKIMVN